jgi:hypothetical protein
VRRIVIFLLIFHLLIGCHQPGPPAPSAPPATPLPLQPQPFSDDEAQLNGMIVDFLAAVFSYNDAKARSYLTPEYNARVTDLRHAAGIVQPPETYSIINSEFTGRRARFDAELHYSDRTRIVVIHVDYQGNRGQIAEIEPGGQRPGVARNDMGG